MANMANLRQEYVIPDVLSSSTEILNELVVKWPNTELDEPGKELGREATQPEPTLRMKSAPSEERGDYVLIMTDPDLMEKNDTNFGQVRHWLVTDVSVNTTGDLTIPKASTYSSYIGPAPLPNYISARPHRYVFILARSPTGGLVKINDGDLKAIQKDYSMAFEGPQEQQDLKDRWGFNAQKFMDLKNLKPEAVTYMLVGGTLKSAVDNVAMTGQAMMNKIVGN